MRASLFYDLRLTIYDGLISTIGDLLSLDHHGFQRSPIGFELFLSRGEAVRLEQVCGDVGRHLDVEAADVILRHGEAYAIGQVADALAVPPVQELTARQRGRLIAAAQV